MGSCQLREFSRYGRIVRKENMSFRSVLMPIIRLFQWSGLSPFQLIDNNGKYVQQSDSFRFTLITAVNLVINLVMGIATTIQTDFGVTQPVDRLNVYGDLMTTSTVRIHAIAVLIESYAQRSIQLKLIAKLDEIEKILSEDFNLGIDKQRLRYRFNKFIAIWLVKMVTFLLTLLLGPLSTFTSCNLHFLVVMFTAFYPSTLSFAQWLVYVDTMRYIVEKMNVCLTELNDASQVQWPPDDGYIFHVVEVFSNDAIDVCERLSKLRLCYCKTWQASALLNRCFRWSFMIGASTGALLIVTYLYSTLYGLLTLKTFPWYDALFCISLTSLLLSDFLFISLICEDISDDVSIFFLKFPIHLLCSITTELQIRRMLFSVHQIPIDVQHAHRKRLVGFKPQVCREELPRLHS